MVVVVVIIIVVVVVVAEEVRDGVEVTLAGGGLTRGPRRGRGGQLLLPELAAVDAVEVVVVVVEAADWSPCCGGGDDVGPRRGHVTRGHAHAERVEHLHGAA